MTKLSYRPSFGQFCALNVLEANSTDIFSATDVHKSLPFYTRSGVYSALRKLKTKNLVKEYSPLSIKPKEGHTQLGRKPQTYKITPKGVTLLNALAQMELDLEPTYTLK